MLPYLLAALILIVSLLLTWAVGFIAALTGVPLLLVRILLVLLGLAGAATLLYFKRKRDLGGGNSPQGTALDDLLREAESKLASSKRTGVKSLRALPVLYVLGDENSAKTTAVLKSGLEPELLAGTIYRRQRRHPHPTRQRLVL